MFRRLLLTSVAVSVSLSVSASAQYQIENGVSQFPGNSAFIATNGVTPSPLSLRFSTKLDVVQDFGAKCDGVTDDTTVIQGALTSSAGKAIVYVPQGTTGACVVQNVKLPSNTHLTIDGKLLLANGSNHNVLAIKTGASNVVIDGIGTIDGNRSNQSTAGSAGIGNEGGANSNVWVSGLTITNVYNWPVNLVNTNGAWLSGLTLSNSGNSVEFASGSSNCWADNLKISAIDDYGFAFYGGIVNCGISHSEVTGSGAGGIVVLNDAGQPAVSTGIIITSNIVTTSKVSAVTVLDNGQPGVNSFVLISNNILHDNNQSNTGGFGGIYLYDCYYVTVTGNQIYHDGAGTASSVGIGISTSAYFTTVTNNTIINEGIGGGLGVGISINGPFANVNNNIVNDDQASKTMAFLLNGIVGTGSIVTNNLLGSSIGKSNNLTYNSNTDYVQQNVVAGTQHLSGSIADGPITTGGTKFTTSGCSVSATTGSGTAGTYTSGTAGSCSVVITMNGATGMTATNGWNCTASDWTTPADTQAQTATTTTSATIAGTTASGDVIHFSCQSY